MTTIKWWAYQLVATDGNTEGMPMTREPPIDGGTIVAPGAIGPLPPETRMVKVAVEGGDVSYTTTGWPASAPPETIYDGGDRRIGAGAGLSVTFADA